MLEICSVGGYSEFGRNMTAVRIDDSVIIVDMGIHMENYIKLQGDEDIDFVGTKRLLDTGSIPEYHRIDEWRDMVKAIIPTHAHLDHVGAIPFLANKYNADIVCTPFTAEVIKAISNDKNKKINNNIKPINPNSTFKLSEDISVDFIHMTHSTPQTAMLAIHSPYGTVVYANDFKFDTSPTLGAKPNFEKIKSLEGAKCLIVDCTRAWDERKTPSESVAKEMLKDVMHGVDSEDNLIVVTTFSSHLARLKSIIELGKEKNRKILMLGRSLDKYVTAGENAGIIDFSDVERIKFKDKIRKILYKVKKNPSKYMLIVTGHQGEPEAILANMVYGKLKYNFDRNDQIIFSCSVIPNEENINNRNILEEKLRDQHVRIFKDIHVSGHAAKEELRDLINMVKPQEIVPAHGFIEMMDSLKSLAIDMGYKEEKIHMHRNGDSLSLN